MTILGASGHGLVVLDAARLQGWCVVGFLDSFKPAGAQHADSEILGHPDELHALMARHGFTSLFVAISDNFTRREVFRRLNAQYPELDFPSVVHPAATVAASSRLGAGVLVAAGAIVNPGCEVGDGCVVNTNASLDHDSQMRPFSSLLPGACTGGNATLGECACVCAGATIIHRVNIGDHSVIGAGAVVLSDVPPETLAVGVPARNIRKRAPDERHM